jgi:hypothetical protein
MKALPIINPYTYSTSKVLTAAEDAEICIPENYVTLQCLMYV